MSSAIDLYGSLSNNNQNHLQLYFTQRKERISFKRLLSDAMCLVGYLQCNGIQAGEHIGIIGRNSYEWVVTDLACFIGNYVSVAFPVDMDYVDIRHYIDDMDIRYVYSEDETWKDYCLPIQKILASAGQFENVEILAQDNPYFTVVFTSGTTGIPKAIGLKASSIAHTIGMSKQVFDLAQNDSNLSFLPLCVFTTRMYIYAAFLYGYNVVLTSAELVWAALKLFSPTIMQGVPFVFENLVNSHKIKMGAQRKTKWLYRVNQLLCKLNIRILSKRVNRYFTQQLGGRMRFLVTGTAPIAKNILEYYRGAGVSLFESYGLNETGVITLNSGEANQIGSVGQPLPGYDVKIGSKQEILVKSVYYWSDGYLANKHITPFVLDQSGYLNTGDIGYIDPEGFVYVTGRQDDVILLKSGKKFSPQEIEKGLESTLHGAQTLIFSSDQEHINAIVYSESGPAIVQKSLHQFNLENPFGIRVHDFYLVNKPFSADNGLLTSNLKRNRKVAKERYAEIYECGKVLV